MEGNLDKLGPQAISKNFQKILIFSLFFRYFQREKARKNGKLGENGREGMKRGGNEWEKIDKMNWRGNGKN